MWDAIFVLISFFEKPHKKKDLYYLLNSRLKNDRKSSLIINYDVNQRNKCNNCQDFRPWMIINNKGEGLFLIKKFVEKFKPWVSLGLLSNFYDKKYNLKKANHNIFIQMNKIEDRSYLYQLLEENKSIIMDQDVRLSNHCFSCKNLLPWLILKNKSKSFTLIEKLESISSPFLSKKYYESIYSHQIPDTIKKLSIWSDSAQNELKNLKINPII